MSSEYEYVDQPNHYQGQGMAVIDVIRAFDLNFACGNVVKYMLRAGKKPDEDTIKELEKALWYLQEELTSQRNKVEQRSHLNDDLSDLARRESGGEWGGVSIPVEPVPVEVADIMHFSNVSHFPPSTRASELTAYIKKAILEGEDDECK